MKKSKNMLKTDINILKEDQVVTIGEISKRFEFDLPVGVVSAHWSSKESIGEIILEDGTVFDILDFSVFQPIIDEHENMVLNERLENDRKEKAKS